MTMDLEFDRLNKERTHELHYGKKKSGLKLKVSNAG